MQTVGRECSGEWTLRNGAGYPSVDDLGTTPLITVVGTQNETYGVLYSLRETSRFASHIYADTPRVTDQVQCRI